MTDGELKKRVTKQITTLFIEGDYTAFVDSSYVFEYLDEAKKEFTENAKYLSPKVYGDNKNYMAIPIELFKKWFGDSP